MYRIVRVGNIAKESDFQCEPYVNRYWKTGSRVRVSWDVRCENDLLIVLEQYEKSLKIVRDGALYSVFISSAISVWSP